MQGRDRIPAQVRRRNPTIGPGGAGLDLHGEQGGRRFGPIEVIVPEEYVGDVVGDISSRRGTILGMEPRMGGITAVNGYVPLSEMFGYATSVRSMTSGRGTFTMEFDRYAPVSQSVAEKVLKQL